MMSPAVMPIAVAIAIIGFIFLQRSRARSETSAPRSPDTTADPVASPNPSASEGEGPAT